MSEKTILEYIFRFFGDNKLNFNLPASLSGLIMNPDTMSTSKLVNINSSLSLINFLSIRFAVKLMALDAK